MRAAQGLRIGVVVAVAVGSVVVAPGAAFATSMDVVGVSATSPTDSSDVKSVTAYCPAGTRILGGGAVLGGNIDVHITGMMPDAIANSWTAYASEHGPGNWPWYVRASAICAPEPAGLVYVADFTGGDSAGSKSDVAFCPPGRKALGVGGRVTGADSRKLFLTYVKPTGTGNGAEVGGVEMTGGYAGDWWLHTWAICATQPAGWEVRATPNPDGERYATLMCPYPKRLTGGGAYISLSLGQLYLTMIRIDQWRTPDGSGDPWPGGVAAETAWVGGDPDGPRHDWYLKAYGICVS